ncbi:hypothetical protein DSO57_1018285 [Entomophthora muscae]|uniref:Uncharacterized protein n=1 Tax=Entomophthora muscae TaxID=34485 RepID=A0ACC2TFS4_9FUNG|nr:hypothetical protein DSO57_1018285 [Entomophthora muscae]
MPANLGVVPPVFETENCIASQCPEFYSEDTLMLSQAIYLGRLWLGLIILLNPSISIAIHKTISEATLVVNHEFYVDLGEKASYYPVISVTGLGGAGFDVFFSHNTHVLRRFKMSWRIRGHQTLRFIIPKRLRPLTWPKVWW